MGINLRVLAITAVATLPLVSGALAEVYMHTDKDGKVSFSDRPAPADKGETTEKLDIKETNTTQAVEPRPVIAEQNSVESVSYQLQITSPANGADITNETRNLTLSLDVRPAPEKGLQLVAFSNGQRAAEQSYKGTSVTINNINRGQQQLQVRLLNSQGKAVASSNSITVNVHRRNLPRPSPR